jgi:DNA-binding ferritin-like protein (Dps family)
MKKNAVQPHNLDQLAQKVWALPKTEVEQKKEILHEMIDAFKFKDKQEKFHLVVTGEDRAARLDKLAADFTLTDTDKVIK